jgi:hypothetical protein
MSTYSKALQDIKRSGRRRKASGKVVKCTGQQKLIVGVKVSGKPPVGISKSVVKCMGQQMLVVGVKVSGRLPVGMSNQW